MNLASSNSFHLLLYVIDYILTCIIFPSFEFHYTSHGPFLHLRPNVLCISLSNSKSIASAYGHTNAKNGKHSKEISALADPLSHSIGPNVYNTRSGDGSA